jgi:CheY-like chemotaxis protein
MDRMSSTKSGEVLRGLRVLVVEDHGPSAASIEEFLSFAGHEVRVVSNGRAAMEAVEADKPDVVLLDIGLPGEMDGYALAKWITEKPATKRPLLVAVTGHHGEEDRRNSKMSGIDLHLAKPVEAGQLQGLLARFQQIVSE